MRRRQFVHGLAGLAACTLTAPALAKANRCGSLSSAAASLAPRSRFESAFGLRAGGGDEGGAAVVQFEKLAPAAGATRNSFAWLNAFVADRHYQALRLASVAGYRRLDEQLGLRITWGGYLNWARDAAESATVSANAAQMAGTPFPTRSLSAAEFTALDPHIEPGAIAAAISITVEAPDVIG